MVFSFFLPFTNYVGSLEGWEKVFKNSKKWLPSIQYIVNIISKKIEDYLREFGGEDLDKIHQFLGIGM